MDTIKQVSIFIENRTGILAKVLKILKDDNINIKALYIAETNDFGILRLIVDDEEKTHDILKKNAYAVSINEVFAIEITDNPGGLHNLIDKLSNDEVDIEYMYSIIGKKSNAAYMIVAVKNLENMQKCLNKHNIVTLSINEVKSI